MATRKVWVIEEVELEDGQVAHRQSDSSYELNADGTWFWNKPYDRMNDEAEQEWDRVLNLLTNVNGEDLRHIVSGVSLMTHCLDAQNISGYSN